MIENPYILVGKLHNGIKIIRVNGNINWVRLNGECKEFYLVELENRDWVRVWKKNLDGDGR